MTVSVKALKQKSVLLILCALAVLHIGFLVFKVVTFYPDAIHSDAAVAPLLAAEVLKSGQIVPEGWYHANNDIWLFSRHFLILPYISIFGLGQASYLAMQLTFLVLLAATAVWWLKPVLQKPSHIFIAISFLAIPFSVKYYSYVYGEIAYGTYLLHIMLVTGLLVRVCLARTGSTLSLALLLVLCLLFSAANPARYVAYMLVPALSVIWFLHDRRNRLFGLAGLLVAVLFLGRYMHQLFTTDLYLNPKGKVYGIANPLSWFGNAFRSLKESFKIVDLATFTDRLHAISIGYTAFLLILAVTAVTVLVFKLRSAHRSGRGLSLRLRYCFALLIFCGVSIVCIFGAFIVINAPIESRILIPPFYLATLLLFAVFLPHAARDWRVGAGYLVVMLVPLLFAVLSNRTDTPHMERQLELANQIKDKGLNYGYATDFWQANVTTLVSQESVTIRAVRHGNQVFRPMRWLSHRDWYAPQQNGRFFVLASQNEQFDFALLSNFSVNHIESKDIDGLVLHVFDGHENLVNLPVWIGDDQMLAGHPHFSTTEVGALAEDGRGVYLENSGPGLLTKGPFLPLRKGDYELELNVLCSEGAQATLDFLTHPDVVQESFGNICEEPRNTLAFTARKNIRRASFRIAVEKGTVKFYGFQTR